MALIKKVIIKAFGEKRFRTPLWQLKFKEWKGTRTSTSRYEIIA